MTRTIGYVPVRIGRGVVPVPVEASENAVTHVDALPGGARVIVAEGLTLESATREVELVMPELQAVLARKVLN